MTFYYGAHMSSTKFLDSMNEISTLGGNFMQVFISNPRALGNGVSVEKYMALAPTIKDYCKRNDFKIVIHSPYYINLAKNKNEINYQIEHLCKELRIAHHIGAIGCVIHVGKLGDMETHVATANMLTNMKILAKYIKDNKLKSKLILETAAGQGKEMFVTTDNSLGNFASFYGMFTEDEMNYIKICVDTCHIFVAGIDIRERKQVDRLFSQLQLFNLLQHVVVIHFNDANKDYSTRVDRHASIGQGFIGFSGLSQVLKKAFQYKIPCVLETPGDAYLEEVPWMKEMVNKLI